MEHVLIQLVATHVNAILDSLEMALYAQVHTMNIPMYVRQEFTVRHSTTFFTDIDECLSGPCGEYESCINTVGYFTCICVEGFIRNTTTGECEGRYAVAAIQQNYRDGSSQPVHTYIF